MFMAPRIIYSLANDGLIFKFLGNVWPRFKTPAPAAVTCGLIAGEHKIFSFICFVVSNNQLFRFFYYF